MLHHSLCHTSLFPALCFTAPCFDGPCVMLLRNSCYSVLKLFYAYAVQRFILRMLHAVPCFMLVHAARRSMLCVCFSKILLQSYSMLDTATSFFARCFTAPCLAALCFAASFFAAPFFATPRVSARCYIAPSMIRCSMYHSYFAAASFLL